jgi:glycosyltransferase involved in cell wall biosynthesis
MADARRILCVYQHAPTSDAPGFYRHRIYFAELVRRGWSVDLVSTPINYMTGEVPERYARKLYLRESIDGIAHHWVWASRGIHASRRRRASNYLTFAGSAVLRGLTLPRPSVVWASSPPLPVGTVGALLARRFRRPWIFEIRDLWPESAASVGWLSPEARSYRALERFAHRYASGADTVIVPTPGLVAGARRHGARSVEVLSGVVLDRPVSDESRRASRERLGVTDDLCLFVYVGAHGVANGLDLILDAAKELGADERILFVLAGDGSDRRRLEGRLGSGRITNVRLLGTVPRSGIWDLLAASDVCLHCLRPDELFHAALPTKILEYLGAHRPFITTVPGIPQQLAVESGGGFAPSVDELVAEVRRWAALDQGERRRRGERSFAYGAGRFGLEPTVDKLEEVLLETMRRREAGGNR